MDNLFAFSGVQYCHNPLSWLSSLPTELFKQNKAYFFMMSSQESNTTMTTQEGTVVNGRTAMEDSSESIEDVNHLQGIDGGDDTMGGTPIAPEEASPGVDGGPRDVDDASVARNTNDALSVALKDQEALFKSWSFTLAEFAAQKLFGRCQFLNSDEQLEYGGHICSICLKALDIQGEIGFWFWQKVGATVVRLTIKRSRTSRTTGIKNCFMSKPLHAYKNLDILLLLSSNLYLLSFCLHLQRSLTRGGIHHPPQKSYWRA